jgi:hypothetical protein
MKFFFAGPDREANHSGMTEGMEPMRRSML